MRRVLLDQVFPSLQMKASIEKLSIQSIMDAQEVFICNSIRGVQSVSGICGEKDYSSSVQTARIQARLGRMYACFGV
jgi:branched-subunit amino acid aminotransferase/4-amino-4-deoxychorismate lyase